MSPKKLIFALRPPLVASTLCYAKTCSLLNPQNNETEMTMNFCWYILLLLLTIIYYAKENMNGRFFFLTCSIIRIVLIQPNEVAASIKTIFCGHVRKIMTYSKNRF